MGQFYYKVMVYEKFGEEGVAIGDIEGTISDARAKAISILKKIPRKRAYVMISEQPKSEKSSRKYIPLVYRGDVQRQMFPDGAQYVWITNKGVQSKVPYCGILNGKGKEVSRRRF